MMLATRWMAVTLVMSFAFALPVRSEGQADRWSRVAGPAPVVLAEVAGGAAGTAAGEGGVTVTASTGDAGEEVDLSPAFLADPAHVKAGRKLWKQCRHCHGNAAYPGKAPKLKPRRYDAAFVYDRITNGFGKMPPWKHVFTATQRAQLVAYILSNRFSP